MMLRLCRFFKYTCITHFEQDFLRNTLTAGTIQVKSKVTFVSISVTHTAKQTSAEATPDKTFIVQYVSTCKSFDIKKVWEPLIQPVIQMEIPVAGCSLL